MSNNKFTSRFYKLYELILYTVDRFPVLSLLGLFIAGIIFWGGFNTSMEATNTESFCISCHEMRDNVYPEYQKSIHYINSSGVRATCPDCHVPRPWFAKLKRKIIATNELYHAALGTIDNREKFQARRLHLAQIVWRTMQSNNSQECRNCHKFDYMDLRSQRPKAQIFHAHALENAITCIGCHKGIAHQLPRGYQNATLQGIVDQLHKQFDQQQTACHVCHEGMAYQRWDE